MKRKWYRFYFSDGYNFCAVGLSKREILGLELDHGPLLAKIPLDD